MLCAVLAGMLKDREGPSSSHASCNGPVGGGRDEAAREQGRRVLPEERRRAVELLRKGEENVTRFCLERVEVGHEAARGGRGGGGLVVVLRGHGGVLALSVPTCCSYTTMRSTSYFKGNWNKDDGTQTIHKRLRRLPRQRSCARCILDVLGTILS